MFVFNFTPVARECKKCNTSQYIVLVQLTNGSQKQKCKQCNNYE